MLSKEETAALFGVDAATIRRWRSAAGLPARKEGEGYTPEEIAQLAAVAKRPNPLQQAQPPARASLVTHDDPGSQEAEIPLHAHARANAHLARAEEHQATLEAILHAQRSIETLLEALLARMEGAGPSGAGMMPSQVVEAVILPRTRSRGLKKMDACRLMGRHGVKFNTAKGWDWPATALVSEQAALRWALSYVAGDPRRGGDAWRDRCDQADCPCQERSDH